jgi:hypothetical protein
MLRLELLNVTAELDRELGQLMLDCSSCGRRVHWVARLGVELGHWAHREPGCGEDRFYGWAGDLLKAASDDGPEDYSKVALATTPVMSEPRTAVRCEDIIVHTS